MVRDKDHTSKLSAIERDIDDAIQRVHARYGTNLSAFFRKVQRDVETNAQSSRQTNAKAPTSGAKPIKKHANR